MKIILGCNQSSDSNIWGSRFKAATNADFKVAAYYINHSYHHQINWCLNPLHKKAKDTKEFFGNKYPMRLNHASLKVMIDEIIEWEPDLIISDAEPITAHIAKLLQIPLWYCSSRFLTSAILNLPKTFFVNFHSFYHEKGRLSRLPEAEKTFVYSFLGDSECSPELDSGYEWITPYHSPTENCIGTDAKIVHSDGFNFLSKILPEYCRLTSADTSFVSDSFYQGVVPVLVGDLRDMDHALNASLIEYLKIGYNATGIQDNMKIITDFSDKLRPLPLALKVKNKLLHEVL